MSPEIEVKPPLLRSKFAFLFGCIAELYRFHYGNKPGTKLDEIKAAVEELKRDDRISDYLVANLQLLFAKYPDLMPGKFQSRKYMEKLNATLDMVNGDLCREIADLSQESAEHDRDSLLTWLNGGQAD